MQIYNTLTSPKTKELDSLELENKEEISMYSCGPTVYNYAHIGNIFSYLAADTLYRWLTFGEEKKVKWVMNITDVDDKTIRDSKERFPDLEEKAALKKLTSEYEEHFKEDLKTLNITGVSEFPRATDYIPEQQALVRKLVENGFAYESEGSVYFDIAAYKNAGHDYGRLVHIDEGFQAGARVSSDEYDKASAADFVVWKGRKAGEPFWDFELNGKSIPGRPGWHLECSAMEEKILGLPFDIHTGGCDLKFPHHEDEIAQSHGAYGKDPTKVWVHNGFLQVEGEKMSKSLGNFYRLKDILDKGWTAEEFRLVMVTTHYRKDFNFTENALHEAKKFIKKARISYQYLVDYPTTSDNSDQSVHNFSDSIEAFKNAMRNDLNTKKAIFNFYRLNSFFTSESGNSPKITIENKNKIISFYNLVSNVFGVDFTKTEASQDIPQEIINLADKRVEAKKAKDFAKADDLRNKISSLGYEVKDTREGYELNLK